MRKVRFKELLPSLNNTSELAGRLPEKTPGFVSLSMFFLTRMVFEVLLGRAKNASAMQEDQTVLCVTSHLLPSAYYLIKLF